MPDQRSPLSSLFMAAAPCDVPPFEVVNKEAFVNRNKMFPFEIQYENAPSPSEVLDAVAAMTDAQKATLRRLLGLPPLPSPTLYLPDGRGGFAPPAPTEPRTTTEDTV